MRVGLVCPYSFDVPGGVQNHVRDLAEALTRLGHEVSVLAPSERPADLPAYVVAAGGTVPVPYNGSVSRIAFGPGASARVRRWLAAGRFDVIHLHEPAAPSLSLLALWATDRPVVATFHSAQVRSRALSASAGILRPWMEKVSGRIAVSEHARETLVHHMGGEPVVIPNGVWVDRYAAARPRPEWQGNPTLVFVGRIGEPRKGFTTLLSALPRLVDAHPDTRVLVVGGGETSETARSVPEEVRGSLVFLGRATERDKRGALASADLQVAPNTGGESFGIVLLEAMAAGTPVLASDLPAFRRVLDEGRFGTCFRAGDPADLAAGALALLADDDARESRRRAAGEAVRRYDWDTVARQVLEVYETVAP